MDLEKRRLQLRDFLKEHLEVDYFYYSPPTGKEMQYPCVVYKLNGSNPIHADNIPYIVNLSWDITIIDEDPDSAIAGQMMGLSKCRFIRSYPSIDLNHFLFELSF